MTYLDYFLTSKLDRNENSMIFAIGKHIYDSRKYHGGCRWLQDGKWHDIGSASWDDLERGGFLFNSKRNALRQLKKLMPDVILGKRYDMGFEGQFKKEKQ